MTRSRGNGPWQWPAETAAGLTCTLLVALITISGCTNDAPPPPAAPPPPSVTVATVRVQSISILAQFPGVVRSARLVEIVPQVSGQLIERSFTEGAQVARGAALYAIDPKPFQARLDAVRAQLEKDRAEEAYWKKEAGRMETLASKGMATKEQRDKAVEQLRELQSAIAGDEANIASAELELGYASIQAPFSGIVEQTLVYEGAQLIKDKTVMTTLLQTDPIQVEFAMSRAKLAEIQRRQRQGLAPKQFSEFPVQVGLGGDRFFPHAGRLNFISARGDSGTDTFAVRAELPNPADTPADLRLIPGQYVLVVVTVGRRPEALLIPKASLVEAQDGRYVYVVDAQSRVQRRTVEVIAAHRGDWVIGAGLAKDETLVVEGLQKLRPGLEVIASSPSAPGQPQDR